MIKKTILIPAMATLIPVASMAEQCQLSSPQKFESWGFELSLSVAEPEWEAPHTAAELYTMVGEYFSERRRSFSRKNVVIPASLGFYDPRTTFSVTPTLRTTKTVEGLPCSEVTGVRVSMIAKPTIFLARELQERNCVSRNALAHQLKHHAAFKQTVDTMRKETPLLKKKVFPVYSSMGVTSRNPSEDARTFSELENAALSEIYALAVPHLKSLRIQNAENMDSLVSLHRSCDGMFGTTATRMVPDSLDTSERKGGMAGGSPGH